MAPLIDQPLLVNGDAMEERNVFIPSFIRIFLVAEDKGCGRHEPSGFRVVYAVRRGPASPSTSRDAVGNKLSTEKSNSSARSTSG
jgi:hypothetical protein